MNDSVPQYFDVTPSLALFIDKDGKWYQNGAEIIHPGIRKQFSDALEKTRAGYRVRLGNEICEVEVEDTPFVVLGIAEDGDGAVMLKLNDGAQEVFSPETLWINNRNVPYTMVKNGQFPARFSRPAYYELAKKVVFDQHSGIFSIVLNGKSIPIKTQTSV